MKKTRVDVGIAPVKRLIDRQRNLYAIAENIDLAKKLGNPLPEDISAWLSQALKDIACGVDANEAFNVIPEKQGVRKDGFFQEIQRKLTNGYIAATTKEGAEKIKTSEAIEKIGEAMPAIKKSTVRKNYNKAGADRNPIFSLSKK